MIKLNNELYDLSMRQTRRLLHQEIDELVYDSEEVTEEMEEELQEAHNLISAKNEEELDGFMIGYDIFLEKVEEDIMLTRALEEAGYTVEESNASRSLYVINDDNEEVRIADHKRPAYQQEGSVLYVDHEYESELLVKDNKVNKKELEAFGIDLDGNEFILG